MGTITQLKLQKIGATINRVPNALKPRQPFINKARD